MQRLQYIPTAIAISLLIANAYSTDTNAITNIVGGHNIQIDVVPHQVAIVLREKLLCGGSILTKKYVLSAAHCVLETLDISLIIHAGTSFWAKPGSIHHVESSTTYGASENVDVAVLRVTEPFVFDKQRQPIRLFPSGGVIKPFTIATVVGWGSTEKFEVSDVLLAVDVPIIDRRLCNISYHGNIAVSEICAGSTHKDSCRGDSGGPLLMKGIQIGIISTGIGCGLTAFPGIYADVSYFHDWIMQQISP